jgi:hypothetical protein
MQRNLLQYSAWGMLVAVALSFVSMIPVINLRLNTLEGSSIGKAILMAALLLVLCDALLLWGSAVWYAWSNTPSGYSSRGLTIMLLLITNSAGGLFYYFFVVSRSHQRSDRSGKVLA